MIILDTNVVSEALKPQPNRRVLQWLIDNSGDDLFLTSINLAEMMAGLALMPDGKRKQAMTTGLDDLLQHLFQGRILPFNTDAARAYAAIHAKTQAAGKTMQLFDAQIAAIAKFHGFAVATRDIEPFTNAGLSVINPWNDGA
jgi:predicted nucleic acid-binding protein